MTRILYAALLIPMACWGGGYKCTQPDGSVVFQQTQCGTGADETQIDTGSMTGDRPSSGAAAPASGRAYSIEGQLKYFQDQRERASRERAGKRERGEARRLQDAADGLKAKLDPSRCAYYESLVKERNHKLLQGYHRETDKLHDEKMLRYYELEAAKHCN